MIITPGKQFVTDERHNTANTNLLGVPSIALEVNEVKDANIESVSGSKVTDIPISSLDAAVQSKFGYKNYCYNPSFENWTAGTSFTSGTTNADGWGHTLPAIAYTIQRQQLAAGESDTLLLGSRYYWRLTTTTTSATAGYFFSSILNPRLFSGKTVTLSMSVKVSSGTLPTIGFFVTQNFGTGGSPSADVTTTAAANAQPTSQWQKIYATINVPTINGKTLGSSTEGAFKFGYYLSNNSSAYQLDVDNVQIELGSSATTFEDIAASKTSDVASLVGFSAGGSETRVGAGSGAGLDTRGVYWKPNVVQTVKTDTFTTSSGAWTALTGLSASITPTSTTSKIKVEVVLHGSTDTGAYNAMKIQLLRGATEISIGDTASSRETASAWIDETLNGNAVRCVCIFFLDAPATTSATTYSVNVASVAGSIYVNRSRSDTDNSSHPRLASSITLTEIPV